MKHGLVLFALALGPIAAQAEYKQIDLTVFGMDCAPCAHAIRVSMKGIDGMQKVDVDLNTGLVTLQLAAGNAASMAQVNAVVEKNGFTHKDATITARGTISGSAMDAWFQVSGSQDRFHLAPAAAPADLASLLGKTVTVKGIVPQSPKGKLSETLRYQQIQEAQ